MFILYIIYNDKIYVMTNWPFHW